MSPIRILIYIAVVWLVWTMVRRSKIRNKTPGKAGKKVEFQKMVRCAVCKTHLPQEQALQSGDQWFCNEKHKDQHNDSRHSK